MTESDQHAKLVAHEKVEKTDEEKKAIGEFVRFRLHKISNRIKKEDLKNYVEEKIEEIRKCDAETREVKQYFYQGWPDCNLPRESKSILCLLQEVRQSAKLCSGKQVVVQCSAGCGRTGCFILMWNMIEMAEREGYVDIAKYAAQLRAQRAYAIGGFEQYLFVYKALANYFDQSD
ncbi:tyrosine-protein phosphatase Lar-like protein [Dinothrombium tinctorium]|uniref:protein-tyrosine-phosphatase n=1 Tax=Dinothrombium tinctorium TaxID=1965070 RepID=A0A443QXV2_9ACAR|nr:tyrosine-protein phosphatase Lar-like protein [Dinothrombium tinctorium]